MTVYAPLKRYSPAHRRLTAWADSLWSAAGLFILVSMLLLAITLGVLAISREGAALFVALNTPFWLMWVAAIFMLGATLISMPIPTGSADGETLTSLPAAALWPLRVGGWVISLVSGIVLLFMLFTGGGSTPPWNFRFSMSVIALLGALGSLFASLGQPLPGLPALAAVWLAVPVLMFIRGLLGLFGLVPWSWRKSSWKE